MNSDFSTKMSCISLERRLSSLMEDFKIVVWENYEFENHDLLF